MPQPRKKPLNKKEQGGSVKNTVRKTEKGLNYQIKSNFYIIPLIPTCAQKFGTMNDFSLQHKQKAICEENEINSLNHRTLTLKYINGDKLIENTPVDRISDEILPWQSSLLCLQNTQ